MVRSVTCALAVAILASAALLSGCGGGSASTPQPSPTASPTAPPAPVPLGCTQVTSPFSLSCGFAPNANTISTSEGAPSGDADFWVDPLAHNLTNYGYGPTKLVRLYICLSGMVTLSQCSAQPTPTGALSAAMLARINAGIASYRGSGIRLILRFTYNFGPIGAPDAPLGVIATHIDQLGPIVNANKDLVYAVEAGFLGTWGEWHDSTNGNITPAAVKTLLDRETGYFGGEFPILVRYPGLLLSYTGGNLTPGTTFGMHDDAYASGPTDEGTFDDYPGDPLNPLNEPTPTLEKYMATLSTTSVLAGEFATAYPTDTTCSALDAYAYVYHLQSQTLNITPSAIGSALEAGGCATTFFNKVGTRIVLQRAQLSGTPAPAGRMQMTLTFVNAGYGRVVRQRPVSLVLLANGSVIARTTVSSLDLRTLASATVPTPAAYTLSFALPATLPPGPIAVALYVADPAPSLSAQPAYALPFNSLNGASAPIFDATTGYNTLLQFDHT